jgi:hypothetical protein
MIPLLLIRIGVRATPPGSGGADQKTQLGYTDSTTVSQTPTIGGGWGR